MDQLLHVYEAAVAVRELRLPFDPSVPPDLRDAAGRVDRAIVDLRAASDSPHELEEAGMSSTVDVVPDGGSSEGQALDGRPPPLWAAYSEVQASLAGFISTVNTMPRMPNESPAYLAAVESAGLALADVRWRHIAAVDFAQEGMPLRLVGRDSDSHDPPDRPDPAPSKWFVTRLRSDVLRRARGLEPRNLASGCRPRPRRHRTAIRHTRIRG